MRVTFLYVFLSIQVKLAFVQNLEDGKWLNWIVEGIVGYFTHVWDAENNEVLPIWTDDTDLTGYSFKRHGYYGEMGTSLARRPADPAYLQTLVRTARASSNEQVKTLTAKMFERFGLSKLDAASLASSKVATETSFTSTYLPIATRNSRANNRNRHV